jgi:hypothetical protein
MPETSLSVRAMSRAKSLVPAPDVHTFCPDTDHPPETAVAKDFALPRSEPASGSESNWHHVSSPRTDGGR